MNEKPVLEINGLSVVYPHAGKAGNVLNNVSFTVYPGQFISIVGESGSGKSTLASAIIGLLPSDGYISGGVIHFDGKDINRLGRNIRGKLAGYIPQDALSGLDPLMRVGRQVEEAVLAHEKLSKNGVRAKSLQGLKNAGLPEQGAVYGSYPHELSGGMKQRVLIASGMIHKPKILIADEPTSALDVILQQKILASIKSLIHFSNAALLFITHDIALAACYSDYVIVMKEGSVVEQGPARKIWSEPETGYTRNLINAAPHTITESGNSFSKKYTHKTARPILEVENVTKYYHDRHHPALKNVSLKIYEGQTLAVIGGSGSGKTTLASVILQLEEPSSGVVRFYGDNIKEFDRSKLKTYHRSLQAVFQNPYESLNPLFSIYDILEEPLRAFAMGTKEEREKRINAILDEVMLPRTVLERLPGNLSGGQCQRVAIARALITEPRLVICDEAVSALDVLVQAQILELLETLKCELHMTYLFITHDLGVASLMADSLIVMQNGEIVETGTRAKIFNNPENEYTKILLEASVLKTLQTDIVQTKGTIHEITAWTRH
jgi:peptide/nickel transport system ATP-binding protein